MLTVPSAAGAVNILRGIDLTVNQGEAIGVVGPSGSGKTSLLMVLAGLEEHLVVLAHLGLLEVLQLLLVLLLPLVEMVVTIQVVVLILVHQPMLLSMGVMVEAVTSMVVLAAMVLFILSTSYRR